MNLEPNLSDDVLAALERGGPDFDVTVALAGEVYVERLDRQLLHPALADLLAGTCERLASIHCLTLRTIGMDRQDAARRMTAFVVDLNGHEMTLPVLGIHDDDRVSRVEQLIQGAEGTLQTMSRDGLDFANARIGWIVEIEAR